MKQTIQPNEILVNGQSEASKSETDGISRRAASKRNVVVLTGAKQLQFEALREHIRAIVMQLRRRNRSGKSVQLSTEESRCANVERCVRVAIRDGLKLPTIRHLGEPHVANFMRWLAGENCSRAYAANVFTDLRHFLESGLQKHNLLYDLKHYIGPGSLQRAPKMSARGISGKVDVNGNPIIAEDLILRVREYDVRAALILQLCLSLGLSRSEAFRFRPRAHQSITGEIYVDGADENGADDRTVRPELVSRFANLATATVNEAKELCPNYNDTIYRRLPLWRAREQFLVAVKAAGILSVENDVSLGSFRDEFVNAAWQAGSESVKFVSTDGGEDCVVATAALQVQARTVHFLNCGWRHPKKLVQYLGTHFRQDCLKWLTRTQRRRAMSLFDDIAFGDTLALERRRLELLSVQTAQIALRALEESVLENYLNGTQHR